MHPARIRSNDLQAAAIMAAHGDHATARLIRDTHKATDSHVWPGALPNGWSNAAPARAGRYWWRRDASWEPVQRTVSARGTDYSHRYCKPVPVETLGGEWLQDSPLLPYAVRCEGFMAYRVIDTRTGAGGLHAWRSEQEATIDAWRLRIRNLVNE